MPGISTSKIPIPFMIMLYGGLPTIHITLPDDDSTDIIVGDAATVAAVIINYVATRGTEYQMGEVFILNVEAMGTDQTWEYQDDDIGLTITSKIEGDDIVMRCTVDNSSADHVTLNYTVETIYLETPFTEPGDVQYVYYDDNVDYFRKGVRDGEFVVDYRLTADPGWEGVEDTDWENLKTTA